MVEGFQRKVPSLSRKVSELSKEDIRVSLIGTVLDKQGASVVLDDGTGRISIGFDKEPECEVNQLVRVFGTVIPLDEGFELRGEIIQDMTGLDLDLLKRVNSLV